MARVMCVKTLLPIDLVMWTKNGARTLPLVLKRINEVIPAEFINNRIIVDDHSTDDTVEIAKAFGWDVIFNEGSGVSDGARTALKHVSTECFISFEQDVLLDREWWPRIPKHLSSKRVAVASGIRLSFGAIAKIEEYSYERYCKAQQNRKVDSDNFFRGKTYDNTIYKTEIIRSLNSFPKSLPYLLHKLGYEWKVDFTVKSIHLRKGLEDELAHCYWYGTYSDRIRMMRSDKPADIQKIIAMLLSSPFRGLHIAFKKNCPSAIYVYSLIRFNYLRGIVDSRKRGVLS